MLRELSRPPGCKSHLCRVASDDLRHVLGDMEQINNESPTIFMMNLCGTVLSDCSLPAMSECDKSVMSSLSLIEASSSSSLLASSSRLCLLSLYFLTFLPTSTDKLAHWQGTAPSRNNRHTGSLYLVFSRLLLVSRCT